MASNAITMALHHGEINKKLTGEIYGCRIKINTDITTDYKVFQNKV